MKWNFSLRIPLLLLLFSLTALSAVYSQRQSQLDAALRYVEQKREHWQLTRDDISDIIVSDQFQSRHNGVSHFYFIQRYQGIEVHNALMGIHLTPTGQLGYATNRFVPNLAEKINTTNPALTPYDAVRRVASELSLVIEETLRTIERNGSREVIFHGGSLSTSTIPVKLFFQPIPGTEEVRLAWNVVIDQIDTPDYWSMRVDALTGKILDKINRTVYCNVQDIRHRHDLICSNTPQVAETNFMPVQEALLKSNTTTAGSARYRVFALPLENPLEGGRTLLVDPQDPVASPYGWHDTDGKEGPEFTITRGNNAHVFLDLDDKNEPQDDEPDGGEDLLFDFPLDLRLEPDSNREAITTQLFYVVNMMHDFAYKYGFDEAAGNYQINTYGNGGKDGDYVEAHVQDGGNLKDADHLNNASFLPTPDGIPGRLETFLYSIQSANFLNVTAPAAISGGYTSGTASYGPAIGSDAIEGQLVAAVDNSNKPNLGCSDIVNVEEITGKIALVDRGSCYFQEKTNNAEAAGAIALVICNFEENVVPMGGVTSLPDVTIPTVMLKSSDCKLIRQFMNAGVELRLALPDASGPEYYDAALDNGVVVHEYAHGISSRLTGGGSRMDCLANDEAMKEGWSDFFALVMAAKPGDAGKDLVSIAGYLYNRRIDGIGVRSLPYTTDLNVNSLAYDDIVNAETHFLGEVWTLSLWDLYWEMVDLYGFDEDFMNGTGGNNMAIQLVMDGLKIQDCNPGYVDGRNAILAADALLYNGAHECLIWEVFARRGIGYDAIQGSSTSSTDNFEGFKTLPQCVKELKIEKVVDKAIIQPGEELQYTLRVANHTDGTASGVTISDVVPDGAVIDAASISNLFPFTITDNQIVWEAGDIPSGQEFELKYKITTDPGIFSERIYYDDMEGFGDNWIQQNLEGPDIWDLSKKAANSGDQSWFVKDAAVDNDQGLLLFDPISVNGTQPVLRFFHKYDTEPISDGGIVQISTDGGVNWDFVDSKLFQHKYRRSIDYSAFAVPNIGGFWGKQLQFVPTYVNLGEYIGENIQIRFRFGSDREAENTVHPYDGWYVDDFEIMDMVNYETEACVSAQNGALACARPAERGTVVESRSLNPVSEIESLGAEIRVFPNPVKDELQVAIEAQRSGELSLSLLSIDGKLLRAREQMIHTGSNRTSIQVTDLPAGMYLLRISTNGELATQKIVVN